jgi:hypothetical protein
MASRPAPGAYVTPLLPPPKCIEVPAGASLQNHPVHELFARRTDVHQRTAELNPGTSADALGAHMTAKKIRRHKITVAVIAGVVSGASRALIAWALEHLH